MPEHATLVPPAIDETLQVVRRRERVLTFAAGGVLATAVFLAAMLAAMFADWLITPFHPLLRVVLTLAAMTAGGVCFFMWAVRPLLSRRRLPDVAGLVDEAVPRLEERWSTVTDLAESTDRPETRGSPALIRQVTREAEDLSSLVDPQQVVSTGPVRLGLRWCGAALAVLVLVGLIDFLQVSVLLRRFWAPTSAISATRVAALTGDACVPRNEPLTIAAEIDGRSRSWATLTIRAADGSRTVQRMSADPSEAGQFSHHVATVVGPFEYRIRSGDGQTPWHRVTVAERPQLKMVEFSLVPPRYSRLPEVRQQGLPRRIRALEGSVLDVVFEVSETLQEFTLKLAGDETQTLSASADGRYRFLVELHEDLSFSPNLISTTGLTNEDPPYCQIVVYRDQFPAVTVTSPGDEVVVRPDDTVKVEFTARDDFGIAKAELVVTDERSGKPEEVQVIDVPLGEQQDAPTVSGSVSLDLKPFHLKQGSKLSYAIRVFDTKEAQAQSGQTNQVDPAGPDNPQFADASPQNPADAAAAPQPPQNQAEQPDAQPAETPAAETPADARTAESSPTNAAQQANSTGQAAQPGGGRDQAKPAEDPAAQEPQEQPKVQQSLEREPGKREEPPQKQSDSKQQNASSSSSSSASGSSTNSKDKEAEETEKPQPPAGAPRPHDGMARRTLPGGQSTAAKSRQIVVDEWAGSFDGQMRRKLELAIEDYLKRLDEALAAGEGASAGIVRHLKDQDTWGEGQAASLQAAIGHLATAGRVTAELTEKSAGTPYAFIALQLADIFELHVSVADRQLHEAARGDIEQKKTGLDDALFHIRRARELLANLTRTYEGVKINQQLAEGMDRIRKMHQVFIEDSLELLGSSRPTLNPKNRKPVEYEIDEEFRKKLKQLLEKKRDIQAELAKILAKDPRLLKRFMAGTRQEADTLRDQMTLLARRQDELQKETAALHEAGEDAAKRAAALGALQLRQARDAKEIADAAATLSENYVTWTPLELDPEEQDLRKLRESIARTAATAATFAAEVSEADPEKSLAQAREIYERLREFSDDLPGLAQAREGNAEMAAHVAKRVAESARLITLVSGWIRKLEARVADEHHVIAQVDQARLSYETAVLTGKIANLRSWLEGLSEEIVVLGDKLIQTLEAELQPQQAQAEGALEANELAAATDEQAKAVATFAIAEAQFDELMAKMIETMDAQPVEGQPNLAGFEPPTLEALLEMLKNESEAAESLGIPNRPSNLQIVGDWLRRNQGGGGGGGGANAAAGALAQSQTAQKRAEEMRRAADAAQKKLVAESEGTGNERRTARGKPGNPRWNTLQSRLEDGLRQVRGQNPPERYRSAIERYFELISVTPSREEVKPK